MLGSNFLAGVAAQFLILLGLGQLVSAHWRWAGVSLVGAHRWPGYAVGTGLLATGALFLPLNAQTLLFLPPALLLVMAALLAGGSYLVEAETPEALFAAQHPAHGGCQPVSIPDGEFLMPGLLLKPPPGAPVLPAAVCIVPGAGDTKTFFKWRLVQTLLATGLTVLVIDPPGHGDYRYRPLAYPDCLAAVPAAVVFLRRQPDIGAVGVIGISLGGALAIESLARQPGLPVEALVVVATPVSLNYTRSLFYKELGRTLVSRAGASLLRDMSARQVWRTWQSGGYRSRHTTAEMLALLRPADNLRQLGRLPILLVYSRRDLIAPPLHAQIMRQAAPHAEFVDSKKASHVLLTLIGETNQQIAGWLARRLTG